MKKLLLITMILFTPVVWAGHSVLVYRDAEAVLKGEAWIGQHTKDGILITAKQALEAKTTPFIGLPEGELRHGSLLRLDNEVDAALIKMGDPVKDPEMLKSHKERAKKFVAFLPVADQVPTLTRETMTLNGTSVDALNAGESDLFLVKINGQSILDGTIELPVKRKKSEFQLEIVNVSTKPMWQTDVQLRSKPKVNFWKKGKKKGLNDIPRPFFKYYYQAMWKPLKPGKSFKVTVEVVHIKETSYVWSLSLKSKSDLYSRKIPVKFTPEQ